MQDVESFASRFFTPFQFSLSHPPPPNHHHRRRRRHRCRRCHHHHHHAVFVDN